MTAYQKKFTSIERSILKKVALLEEKKIKAYYNNDFYEFIATEREITKIKRTNEELIKRYSEWGDGHDYNP